MTSLASNVIEDDVIGFHEQSDDKTSRQECLSQRLLDAIQERSWRTLEILLKYAFSGVLNKQCRVKLGKKVAEWIFENEDYELLEFYAKQQQHIILDFFKLFNLMLLNTHYDSQNQFAMLTRVCALFPTIAKKYNCTKMLCEAIECQKYTFFVCLLQNFAKWDMDLALRCAMYNCNMFCFSLLSRRASLEDRYQTLRYNVAWNFPVHFAVRLLRNKDLLDSAFKQNHVINATFNRPLILTSMLGFTIWTVLNEKEPIKIASRHRYHEKRYLVFSDTLALSLGFQSLCLPVLLLVEIATLVGEPFTNCIEWHHFWHTVETAARVGSKLIAQ